MVWTLSDEALLAGLGQGDPDAAAEFLGRFQRRVFGMTRSILRDPHAADDAAQEVFVRAWKHASAYDARKGTVAAWLLTIARNVSINMLPSHRSFPVDPDEMLDLQRATPSTASGDAQIVPVPERMRDALLKLPDVQRRALVLAVFYGYTAQQVSDLDGTPLGTVKTRIRSALAKLRAEIEVLDE